jgi:hypothetical protein
MDLVYDLQISNDLKNLEIIIDGDKENPIRVSISNDTGLIQEIDSLPLFKNDKKVIITFSEVYGSNYNSVELFDKKWGTDEWRKDKGIAISGKTLFQILKSNVSKLHNLIKDDSKFKEAMKVYLTPSSNTGELNNGDKFPFLLAKRHMLYKITALLYISFTVAEQTMCQTEESQELDYQKAKKRYNGLSKLLTDTTNLLLNIDVINKNPSLPAVENENVMLPGLPVRAVN